MDNNQLIWSNILNELQKSYDQDRIDEVFNECSVLKDNGNGLIYILVNSNYIKVKLIIYFIYQ